MSKIEVNQISSQCGSTLTIGQSGDTVTLAAGATQSGFGRTGTVDWDTTAKTAGFTAVSGTGYFVNTTSGAITVTLPATPSAGDIVSLSDYASTWDTNNVTIASALINGATGSPTLSTKGQAVTFIYVDGTRGWKAVQDNTQDISGAAFITATGGTVTCCGDYKIHTFTGPGTFTVTCAGNPAGSNTVDYLVIAGGGGGGDGRGGNNCGAGGGGAGGYRESSGAASGCYTVSPLGSGVSALPVTATGYPITVGGGGVGASGTAGPSSPVAAANGSNSVFSTITSSGGGFGGGIQGGPIGIAGNPGGSGGGSGTCSGSPTGTGGSGNTPPVSPPQGNNGAPGGTPGNGKGGGGGAIAAGSIGPGCAGGAGGAGATSAINATPTARAGGGGGGGTCGEATGGAGGTGGGGTGGTFPQGSGTSGTTNTGGGGGAQSSSGPSASGSQVAGSGGSGIVIIRYKYQ